MLKTHARKLGWLVVVLTLGAATHKGQREWKLHTLMQAQALAAPPSHDAKASVARLQRARKLYRLWRARGTRDVSAEVAPFLHDGDDSIRRSAVRILARLEIPQAEHILAEFARQNKQSRAVPDLTVQLALARLSSRQLRGQARLDAVAKSVDLSWNEVVRLSRKVNVYPRSRAAGTPADEIVSEFLNLLSVMGRHGEQIAPFSKQLTLTPAQTVQLQSASLPDAQATQTIVNYLSRLTVVTGDDSRLGENYLINLGPSAELALIQRLKLASAQPRKSTQNEGLVTLLRSVVFIENPRVIPTLKLFTQDKNDYIRSEAMISMQQVQQKLGFPPLP